MMKKLICICVLTAFISTLFTQNLLLAFQQQSERYSLAVLNFSVPDGSISSTETRVMTARFTEEISNVGMFFTMSQADMERGLVTKRLDTSGCESFDCAVRAGKALDVQLVIFGTIRESGPVYAIDLQMIHVGTQREVKTLSDVYEGERQELIDDMPMFARRLLGESAPQRPERERNPEPRYIDEFSNGGGGFKWQYVGIGLLIAGGVGAGVFLSQQEDSDSGNGGTSELNDLPGPPTFP